VTLRVKLLPAGAADDEALVADVVRVINRAYADGEQGLWVEGGARITPVEVAEAIRRGEIVAGRRDGAIVGCASVRMLDATTADLGLISVDPEYQGGGLGREVVRAAEELMRSRGVATAQLELLVPTGWVHPWKTRLRAWYERLGYRVVRTAEFDEVAPQLRPQLATPCEFLVFTKPLRETG
jgi:ribosomal protein S18 acetylase RimI-like enzyme